jgi:hypothetical protein
MKPDRAGRARHDLVDLAFGEQLVQRAIMRIAPGAVGHHSPGVDAMAGSDRV